MQESVLDVGDWCGGGRGREGRCDMGRDEMGAATEGGQGELLLGVSCRHSEVRGRGENISGRGYGKLFGKNTDDKYDVKVKCLRQTASSSHAA